MLSIWEKESFIDYDLIIIGAGITGLSTAASFKEDHPEANVLIIERGTLPTGASTKNAGFACFGSISELVEDIETLGADGMVSLVNRRWSGLQKTINRLGADPIDFLQQGGYELLNDQNEHFLDQIDEVNDLLSPLFEQPVFQEASDKLKDFRFGKTSSLIYNQYEGQLHTGKLIKKLWAYCNQLGVLIITGTEILSVEEMSSEVCLNSAAHTFKAKAVAICTNAFTAPLAQEQLNIQPGRGMVMLVTPSQPTPFKGTFHYDAGYYYFRDFGNQVLFGGGRNLALEQENTTEFGLNPAIEKKLMDDLKNIILPEITFDIEMKWSGIMAFGESKAPIVKKLAPRQYVGVRLGGMGVALGSLIGEELASQISQDHF